MEKNMKKNIINKRFFATISMALFALTFSAMTFQVQAEEKKPEKVQEKKLTKEEAIKNLDSSDAKTQIEALKFIGQEKETSALPKVGSLVKNSPDKLVRGEAVKTLSSLGEKEKANPFLTDALKNDQDSYVRYLAIMAVVRLGDEKAVDALDYAYKTETDADIKDVLERLLIKFGKIKKK